MKTITIIVAKEITFVIRSKILSSFIVAILTKKVVRRCILSAFVILRDEEVACYRISWNSIECISCRKVPALDQCCCVSYGGFWCWNPFLYVLERRKGRHTEIVFLLELLDLELCSLTGSGLGDATAAVFPQKQHISMLSSARLGGGASIRHHHLTTQDPLVQVTCWDIQHQPMQPFRHCRLLSTQIVRICNNKL